MKLKGPLQFGVGILDLGPDLVIGVVKLSFDLHQLRVDRLQPAAGISPLGRHLEDQRGLQHLPVQAEGTRE